MANDTPQQASLTKRTFASIGWMFTSSGASLFLAFARSVVMTRFLPPEAFGLVAAAALIHAFALITTDIGVAQSVVREKDGADARFLRVAWTIQLLRSGVISCFILLVAVLLFGFSNFLPNPESAFARPELPILIALFAIVAFIDGAVSTNWFLADRKLELRALTLIQLFSQIAGFVGALVFVQFSATVWALFFGILMTSVTKTLLSHIWLTGPKMKLLFDREISGRLWIFGKWILGSSILNFVAGQADKVFLANGLGVGLFGIFSIANNMIEAANKLVGSLTTRIGYSVLSEVRNKDPEALKSVFKKCSLGMTWLCLSMALVGVLVSVPLVEAVYPENFHGAGLYLQLMAPSLFFRRYMIHNQLVLSAGNSRAIAIGSTLRAVAICLFVPPSFAYLGVEGALVAAIIARNISIPYIIYMTTGILDRRQVYIDVFWYIFALVFLFAVFAYQQGLTHAFA